MVSGSTPPATDPGQQKGLVSLLRNDVTYSGWEYQIAEKRCFYVRGFTWFRSNVLRNVTDLKPYEDRAKELLLSRAEWIDQYPSFEWHKKFSYRQAVDAASERRKPLKFQKAVETLTLCEAAADALKASGSISFSGSDIYQNMIIEPAVSYINDINGVVFKNMLETMPELTTILRERTGQPSNTVFYHMFSEERVVTHRLALKSKEVLDELFPNKAGDVGFRFNPNRVYDPSMEENIDAKY